MVDDTAMMWDEIADIGKLLHELGDEELDTPSLCDGWRVRDVLGHMALGHTTPMGAMTVRIARYGFNVTKASRLESKAMFEGTAADEVRRFWDDVMVGQHPRKGISRLIPTKASFLDHLVHNQDIRRPTGRRRSVPEERMRRALELVRAESTPLFSPKRNVAGLRLKSTDVEWQAGDGPVVEGPAEAIVMAASGRKAGLAELHGEGVEVLRRRIGA